MRALSVNSRSASRSVAREKHADADAEALFRAFSPFVARLLYRLGVAAEDLDDVVQEVFLVVHRNGGYARGPASQMTYLANIAIGAAASWRRRDRTKRARWSELPLACSSNDPGPVEILEEREAMRRLQQALDELEPSLRAVLVLVDLEGVSCTSIAAGLGIPIGTVYWRIHRARALFWRAVKAMSDEESRGESQERRTRTMAIRSMFVWRSTRSNELLEVGRARPPVRYDSQAALARHQGLVRMGAAPPSWADPRIFGLVKSAGPVVTAPWVACSAVVIAAGVAAAAHARSGAQLTAAVAPSRVAVHAAPPASVAVAGAATAPWAPSAESPSAVEATASPAPLEAVRGPAAPHAHEAAKAGAPGGGRARRALRDADATSAGPSTASAANASSAEPAPTDDPAVASPVVAPSATDADDRREMQETSAAARLLATDPSRALALVRASDARFPNGYMREERRYVAVMALFALGRRSEARAAAGVFLHEHPTGTFSDKIRAAMAGDGNAGR